MRNTGLALAAFLVTTVASFAEEIPICGITIEHRSKGAEFSGVPPEAMVARAETPIQVAVRQVSGSANEVLIRLEKMESRVGDALAFLPISFETEVTFWADESFVLEVRCEPALISQATRRTAAKPRMPASIRLQSYFPEAFRGIGPEIRLPNIGELEQLLVAEDKVCAAPTCRRVRFEVHER